MYSYYALKAMHYRVPRFVSMAITVAQLSQMVAGCAVNLWAYQVSIHHQQQLSFFLLLFFLAYPNGKSRESGGGAAVCCTHTHTQNFDIFARIQLALWPTYRPGKEKVVRGATKSFDSSDKTSDDLEEVDNNIWVLFFFFFL